MCYSKPTRGCSKNTIVDSRCLNYCQLLAILNKEERSTPKLQGRYATHASLLDGSPDPKQVYQEGPPGVDLEIRLKDLRTIFGLPGSPDDHLASRMVAFLLLVFACMPMPLSHFCPVVCIEC